ncbi:restriction endonuclease [Bacillus pumilus]|uniref:restriction endonuclease n=1 Tax=Bacillus pumilus TaxID=1408 RepID=UPI001C243139|nr:restriction endonuclease [Bacillus pumilus]MBU8726906.1 restriction endonuclease [Bacillus pumilus]
MENSIKKVLREYSNSFTAKTYSDDNNDFDILMDVFGVTPELKRENRQYWGRELGMAWQRLVVEIFKHNHPNFGEALRYGSDEPCDLVAGSDAIDTKYRIGSGDSGTLKKFKQYGKLLREQGYRPVLLIVREDNLSAAIKACEVGNWHVLTGEDSFKYIFQQTGVDVKQLLSNLEDEFKINRG